MSSRILHFKKFQPFMNRVLVKKAEGQTKSKGGIILKDKEEVNFGTVIATGPGLQLDNGKIRETLVKNG